MSESLGNTYKSDYVFQLSFLSCYAFVVTNSSSLLVAHLFNLIFCWFILSSCKGQPISICVPSAELKTNLQAKQLHTYQIHFQMPVLV